MVSELAIWRQSRIAWLQRAPKYVKDTILTAALLFAQSFGASSDSLEHFFYLAVFLGRDILKCTFDESGVLAEDRNEYSVSLLCKRDSANAAIAVALHTTDQPLPVQRSTATLTDPGLRSTFGPIALTGIDRLCSRTSRIRKSESPKPSLRNVLEGTATACKRAIRIGSCQ